MRNVRRREVEHLNARRRIRRAKLKEDYAQARNELHPETIKHRWISDQRARIGNIRDQAKAEFKKNAPIMGAFGIGILLFLGRKPISDLMKRITQKESDQ